MYKLCLSLIISVEQALFSSVRCIMLFSILTQCQRAMEKIEDILILYIISVDHCLRGIDETRQQAGVYSDVL